ncbi:MAG: hypothetical protein IAF58_20210 [Leptolyngbya sp.]|nr:hypothetical protein [Candidatus Melainabacteria bacterium]
MLRPLNGKTLAVSLGLISFAIMPACFADEVTSTSVDIKTPVAAESTSVSTRTDALGSSSTVKKNTADSFGNSSSKVKSRTTGLGGAAETEASVESGPGGTASSASRSSVGINAAGGVTSNKRKVENVNTPFGAKRKVSDATSATSADGTSATVKKQSETTVTP